MRQLWKRRLYSFYLLNLHAYWLNGFKSETALGMVTIRASWIGILLIVTLILRQFCWLLEFLAMSVVVSVLP